MGIGSSASKIEVKSLSNYDLSAPIGRAVEVENLGHILLLFSKDNSLFEVILYNPMISDFCFSLMLFEDFREAQERFMQLADHIGPFIKYIRSIFDTEKLKSIIECFREHPNWTAAHVAAELELIDCFDCEEFMKEMEHHLSEEEIATLLQLACKDGKDKTIAKLIEKKPLVSKDMFGNTPLHYLVENHPDLVERVVAVASNITNAAGDQLKSSLDSLNNYSESPVHVAIRLSQEKVLKILLENGANCRMPCGDLFAIHLALKSGSHRCAEILLKHDAKCAHDRDKKYEAKPLHWARSSKMVDVLLKYETELDVRAADGKTALHVMAKKKRLDCVVTLISNGVDVNAVCSGGRNALHYAVEGEDLDVVKALLLFGVDHELKDKSGMTPLELANDMPDSVAIKDLRDALKNFGQSHRGHYQNEQKEKRTFGKESFFHKIHSGLLHGNSKYGSILKKRTGKEAVLCMDGGGIRGLVLTELLFGLEEVTGQPVREMFDWISGTSTGSYLALAIADGKSIEHCQLAYLKMKQSVFQGRRPFPSEPLEKFLIDEFSEDRKMSSIEYPRLIVPAVMSDRKPAVVHLFRNYTAPYDEHFLLRDTRFARPKKPDEQEIWRSARCSGAAPTYFRTMDRYIDGGIIANNPTLDVLTEIHKFKKFNRNKKNNEDYVPAESNVITTADVTVKGTNDDLGIVISLGTGRAPLEVHQGIDLFTPSSIWETTEVILSARCFGELLIDQVTNSDDHVVERAKSWCEMIGVNYFRINPNLTTDVELDENDDRKLINMLWDTRLYLRKNRKILENAGRILLGC